MDYYLHREGRDEGIFPLDELRQRRQTGELNGSEYVWRAGMAEWQTLDSVLQPTAPGKPAAVPPPIAPVALERPKNHAARWIAAVVLSLLAVLVIVGVAFAMLHGLSLAHRQDQTAGQTVPQNSETALEAASKPVSWTSNTLTEADLRKQHGEFRQRQWLQGYEERGDRSEACDADAAAYLKTWIARNFGGDVATSLPSTQDWSDKLANEPACTDPLILTVTGLNSSGLPEKIRRLDRAVTGFENSKHLAYPRFCAEVSLAAELRDQPRRVVTLHAAAMKHLREAFADGSFQSQDQAEIADILINDWGYDFFYRYPSEVSDIAASAGKSFAWLTLVLQGEDHIIQAWKARGGGYANTVTAAGWRSFSYHLAAARQCFAQAWQLRPDLPMAPERMIYVSLGDSGIGEMRVWFDRTIAAQIDNPQAWADLRWGLRPRWYGDLNSMLALGVTAVNTRRFDTDVPHKLFDVVSDLESEQQLPPGTHIYGREDIWPEMQRMYEGYIAAATQPSERYGWQSTYSAVAYLAGKYDVARTQLEAMNWQPWRHNLTGWDTDLSLMTGEVAARTGPCAAKVAEAEICRDTHWNDKALNIYTALAAATNLDERTRAFAQNRCASLLMEQQFEKGGWVDFLPQSDDDPNWYYAWDESHRVSDGALEIKSGPVGHLCYSRVRIGSSFEVQGEFEVVGTSTRAFQAGLVMGTPTCDAGFYSFNWYAFRMKQNADEGQVACLSQGFSRHQVVKSAALNSDRNTFHFLLRGDVCSASVNGVEIFSSTKAPEAISVADGQFLLGLGAFNNNNDTVIRYRNVQVRKLQ